MALYKVLTSYPDANGTTESVRLAVYTTVPAGNNELEVPWTTVAREYMIWRNRREGRDTTAESPVPQAVQDQLDAGTLFEWTTLVTVTITDTVQQKVVALETQLAAQEAARLAELGQRLKYWGPTGNTEN